MIIIGKWLGLITNASPYSIPPESAVTQVNLQALIPGELDVRKGLTSVTFTTHSGSTSPIVSVFSYQHSTTPHTVYQNSAGRIFVGKGAS